MNELMHEIVKIRVIWYNIVQKRVKFDGNHFFFSSSIARTIIHFFPSKASKPILDVLSSFDWIISTNWPVPSSCLARIRYGRSTVASRLELMMFISPCFTLFMNYVHFSGGLSSNLAYGYFSSSLALSFKAKKGVRLSFSVFLSLLAIASNKFWRVIATYFCISTFFICSYRSFNSSACLFDSKTPFLNYPSHLCPVASIKYPYPWNKFIIHSPS